MSTEKENKDNFEKLKKLLLPFETQLNLPNQVKLETIDCSHEKERIYTTDCQNIMQLGLVGVDLNKLFGTAYDKQKSQFDLQKCEPQNFASWRWLDNITTKEISFLEENLYYVGNFPFTEGLFQIAKGAFKGKLALLKSYRSYWIEDVTKAIEEHKTLDEILQHCDAIEILKEYTDLEDYFIKRICSILKTNIKIDLDKIISKSKDKNILKISGKKLTEIPEVVFQMTHLVELNASKNNIKSIGDGIGNLINLEVLRLDYNQIEFISPEISKLKKLRKLNIGYNAYSGDLPEYLFEFEALNELEIMMAMANGNRAITSVPEALFKLKNLNKFSNGGMYFTNYPCTYGIKGKPLYMQPMQLALYLQEKNEKSSIEYLFNNGDSKTIKNILNNYYDSDSKTMNFSKGRRILISSLPKELLEYDIRILILEDCEMGIGADVNNKLLTPKNIRKKYAELHQSNLSIISSLINLEELNMANNGILALPDLKKLVKLKKLKVNNNHLNDLDGLSELKNLIEINLNVNEFEAFPEGISNLTKLEQLHVRYSFTNEKDITLESLKELSTLKSLAVFNQSFTRTKTFNEKQLKEYVSHSCIVD